MERGLTLGIHFFLGRNSSPLHFGEGRGGGGCSPWARTLRDLRNSTNFYGSTIALHFYNCLGIIGGIDFVDGHRRTINQRVLDINQIQIPDGELAGEIYLRALLSLNKKLVEKLSVRRETCVPVLDHQVAVEKVNMIRPGLLRDYGSL